MPEIHTTGTNAMDCLLHLGRVKQSERENLVQLNDQFVDMIEHVHYMEAEYNALKHDRDLLKTGIEQDSSAINSVFELEIQNVRSQIEDANRNRQHFVNEQATLEHQVSEWRQKWSSSARSFGVPASVDDEFKRLSQIEAENALTLRRMKYMEEKNREIRMSNARIHETVNLMRMRKDQSVSLQQEFTLRRNELLNSIRNMEEENKRIIMNEHKYFVRDRNVDRHVFRDQLRAEIAEIRKSYEFIRIRNEEEIRSRVALEIDRLNGTTDFGARDRLKDELASVKISVSSMHKQLSDTEIRNASLIQNIEILKSEISEAHQSYEIGLDARELEIAKLKDQCTSITIELEKLCDLHISLEKEIRRYRELLDNTTRSSGAVAHSASSHTGSTRYTGHCQEIIHQTTQQAPPLAPYIPTPIASPYVPIVSHVPTPLPAPIIPSPVLSPYVPPARPYVAPYVPPAPIVTAAASSSHSSTYVVSTPYVPAPYVPTPVLSPYVPPQQTRSHYDTTSYQHSKQTSSNSIAQNIRLDQTGTTPVHSPIVYRNHGDIEVRQHSHHGSLSQSSTNQSHRTSVLVADSTYRPAVQPISSVVETRRTENAGYEAGRTTGYETGRSTGYEIGRSVGYGSENGASSVHIPRPIVESTAQASSRVGRTDSRRETVIVNRNAIGSGVGLYKGGVTETSCDGNSSLDEDNFQRTTRWYKGRVKIAEVTPDFIRLENRSIKKSANIGKFRIIHEFGGKSVYVDLPASLILAPKETMKIYARGAKHETSALVAEIHAFDTSITANTSMRNTQNEVKSWFVYTSNTEIEERHCH